MLNTITFELRSKVPVAILLNCFINVNVIHAEFMSFDIEDQASFIEISDENRF